MFIKKFQKYATVEGDGQTNADEEAGWFSAQRSNDPKSEVHAFKRTKWSETERSLISHFHALKNKTRYDSEFFI